MDKPHQAHLKNPTTMTIVPGIYLWGASFGAWSPDDRYLIAPVTISRRITLPNQPVVAPAILHAAGADTLVSTNPHDAAMASLYPSLLQLANSANSVQGGTLAISLDWRPDGKFVAAQPQISDAANVTLYDCATGHVSATLTHDAGLTPTISGGAAFLRWSPDGKHLALADAAYDTLTIWTFDKPLA